MTIEQYKQWEIESEKRLRCTGRSTRLIDMYIQELFHKGAVIILDHYENGTNRQANDCLFKRVVMRLEREHRHEMEHIKLNKGNHTIKYS